MPPCIAYEEIINGLIITMEENFKRPEQTLDGRLDWLLRRHNTDGSHGCDWCLLAQEIRQLRFELRETIKTLELERDLAERPT